MYNTAMDKQAFVQSLKQLGIAPGETLLLCGKQPRDPDFWLEGFWDVLGPDGTLLTHHPLIEAIRQRPGSQSYGIYTAIGARAGILIHPHRDAYGFDSPVGRLFRFGGRVLLLGGDIRENIGMHLAASMAMETPCQQGFEGMAQRMGELEGFREGRIFGSICQAMPIAPLINLASKLYCQAPHLLRCSNPQCPACYFNSSEESSQR